MAGGSGIPEIKAYLNGASACAHTLGLHRRRLSDPRSALRRPCARHKLPPLFTTKDTGGQGRGRVLCRGWWSGHWQGGELPPPGSSMARLGAHTSRRWHDVPRVTPHAGRRAPSSTAAPLLQPTCPAARRATAVRTAAGVTASGCTGSAMTATSGTLCRAVRVPVWLRRSERRLAAFCSAWRRQRASGASRSRGWCS